MTMTDNQSGDFPPFVAPVIQDNPSGWGPCELPDQFKDMPYQPFSKGDRLGKISDWTGAAFQDKKYASKLFTLANVLELMDLFCEGVVKN